MVSKRDRLNGLYNGTRCRICGRKLTNEKSVYRQIGPVCWKKLEKSNYAENMKLRLHKYETRCQECGHPIADVRHIANWRERFDEVCTKFCCSCCPVRDQDPCPKEKLYSPWQQLLLEAYV